MLRIKGNSSYGKILIEQENIYERKNHAPSLEA